MGKFIIDDSKSRYDQIANERDFVLSIDSLCAIHKTLFEGIYPFAGIIMNYTGHDKASIMAIYQALIQEFIHQFELDYKTMSREDVVKNISRLTANIWSIHPFIDGNTRTIYFFIHNYLKSLGYEIDLNIFKQNTVYFKNAIVRAVYENKDYNIVPDISGLERYFSKCLIDKDIKLDIEDVLYDEEFARYEGIKR